MLHTWLAYGFVIVANSFGYDYVAGVGIQSRWQSADLAIETRFEASSAPKSYLDSGYDIGVGTTLEWRIKRLLIAPGFDYRRYSTSTYTKYSSPVKLGLGWDMGNDKLYLVVSPTDMTANASQWVGVQYRYVTSKYDTRFTVGNGKFRNQTQNSYPSLFGEFVWGVSW